MNTKEILALIPTAAATGSGTWGARCPAHDDATPSLSITQKEDGRTLLHCHAGCAVDAICEALKINTADLFPAKRNGEHGKIVAAYAYNDRDGKLLFEVVRFEPKTFRQRRPDGNGGWTWETKGVVRPIYRLPETLRAVAHGLPILITEGEKDVEVLVQRGFSATCNSGGAGKWKSEYCDCLRAADIYVIADRDAPGRKHAEAVAASLDGIAASVHVLELPDVNGKAVKDAADFFAAGGTAGQLQDLLDSAPEWTLPIEEPTEPTAEPEAETPAAWFSEKFPELEQRYGAAVEEVFPEGEKGGRPYVKDMSEDFLAATLAEEGTPATPTVYVAQEGRFYTYSPTDGIFSEAREAKLAADLSDLILRCARACSDQFDGASLMFKFRDSSNLRGVLARARGVLEVGNSFFETGLEQFVPCANGMLRIAGRALLPFGPQYRRRNKLAVQFHPGATCPMFADMLLGPALDPDDIELLQRWCGLALIGVNLAQRMVILTGTAGGGKGTFVRVLNGIIGPSNVGTLRPELLGERFELGRLLGKSLLYGADVQDNFLNCKGASTLKALTGGDPVTLEFKGSNERPEIICRFNAIVTCNSRLTVHLEGDAAAWRRRLAIVEYRKAKPKTVIADLSERILAEEGPGVLNWMLEGLEKIQTDGWQLRLNERQQGLVDNLLLESDGLTLFVHEALCGADGNQLTVADCFAAYVEFCNQRGWTALTRKKFGDLIGDAVTRTCGLTVRHDVRDAGGKAQRGWFGLRLGESTRNTPSAPSENPSITPRSDEPDGLFPTLINK